VLEDLAPRPLADMPAEVLADMETSDVSIFAVKAQANELRTRMQMTDVVNRRKMRHAHMVNIDRRVMLEGMRADFDEVDRISTHTMSVCDFLEHSPETISRFVLLDHMDWLSDKLLPALEGEWQGSRNGPAQKVTSTRKKRVHSAPAG